MALTERGSSGSTTPRPSVVPSTPMFRLDGLLTWYFGGLAGLVCLALGAALCAFAWRKTKAQGIRLRESGGGRAGQGLLVSSALLLIAAWMGDDAPRGVRKALDSLFLLWLPAAALLPTLTSWMISPDETEAPDSAEG